MNSKGTALITGATSGIGAEFARQLAAEGYNLIITGRRKNEIKHIAAEIGEKTGAEVQVIIAELSEDTGREKVLRAIRKTGDLKVLVNNAGFGNEGLFHETDFASHEMMLNVHNLALMKFAHAAVPVMLKNDGGSIINLASIAAKDIMPGQSIYCASKAFVITFSEVLHMELRAKGIKVQALCPGFTRTDFHDKMGYGSIQLPAAGFIRWTTPDRVVKYSLKSLAKNRVICVPGFLNRFSFRLPGLLPRSLYYSMFSGKTDLKKLFNVK